MRMCNCKTNYSTDKMSHLIEYIVLCMISF